MGGGVLKGVGGEGRVDRGMLCTGGGALKGVGGEKG